jgi:NADH:ubiquinone oxidoreductase subunit
MLGFLGKIFAWWNGATLGTLWTIRRSGELVGEDAFGNRYFQERKAGSSADGKPRRWVVYNGYADASRIPADWHGWLHRTFEESPVDAPLPRRPWELDHKPNMTGTVHAYRPSGSLASSRQRQRSTADYEAWSPEG